MEELDRMVVFDFDKAQFESYCSKLGYSDKIDWDDYQERMQFIRLLAKENNVELVLVSTGVDTVDKVLCRLQLAWTSAGVASAAAYLAAANANPTDDDKDLLESCTFEVQEKVDEKADQ